MPLLPALLACAPDDAGPTPVDPEALLDAAAVHDATFALTSIGARLVGTDGETAARDEVVAMLEGAGFAEVERSPFTFDAWRPGTASITAGGRTVEVEALSPSPAAEVTLTLRDESDPFTGDAVLLSSLGSSRAEAFLTASLGGAAALVRVTDEVDEEAGPLIEVGHLLDGTTLPAIAVDHETGEWLRTHLDETVALSIHPDPALGWRSENLRVRVPAAGNAPGRVWVVAHYDSWHVSECAFDNALGVGALVRLAERARLAGAPEHELVFLATSGEEQGLKGALAFAEAHGDEIGPADTVVVLDVAWSAEGTYLALGSDEGIRALGMELAAARDLEAEDGLEPGLGSDHLPFLTRGARTLWMGRWPDRHYHTVADTLDQLDFDEVERVVRTQWDVIVALAGIPE